MSLGGRWVERGLVAALAVTVGLIVYLAVSDDGGGEPASEPQAAEARIVDAEELAAFAADAGRPVYGAGERGGARLELAVDAGSALVRYLREGDEAGAAPAGRIAVGTYALPDPRGALGGLARTRGATVRNVPGVGRVVTVPQAPSSAYFADPGNRVQIEVYAPSAARAIGLVRSGRVRPVD
jgi:hypothetical protein